MGLASSRAAAAPASQAPASVQALGAEQPAHDPLPQLPPLAAELLPAGDAGSAFSERFGPHGYAYGRGAAALEALRERQFPQLREVVYLDHAAATLYARAQVEAAAAELQGSLFGNPHSQLGCSASELALARLRALTLRMCNAAPAEYEVVFTSGATAALKLAGECFPWRPGSCFAYTLSNHNSVLGIREQALAAGGVAQAYTLRPRAADPAAPGALTVEPAGPCMGAAAGPARAGQDAAAAAGGDGSSNACCSLLALPLECNFSGERLQPGSVLEAVKTTCSGHRWLLLVDAAKACATHPPDLAGDCAAADMVALSYYKVFGYPTGLGALVVRRSLLPLMAQRKRYFGGGTVEVSVAAEDFVRRRPGAAGLEDGTQAFLAAAAACHGFSHLASLGGLPAVARHTACLSYHAVQELASLQHANGAPVVELYCSAAARQLLRGGEGCDAGDSSGAPSSSTTTSTSAPPAPPLAATLEAWQRVQGPVLAFNVRRPDGAFVGYNEVQQLARIHGLCLRTGCFCNPGACAAYLGLSGDDMKANYEAGHVCWDAHDLMNGRPTGAVRASLGHMSSWADVACLLGLLRRYFLDAPPAEPAGRRGADEPAESRSAAACHAAAASAPDAALSMGRAGAGGGAQADSTSSNSVSLPTDRAPPAAAPGVLAAIYLYPIKSCCGQRVDSWPLGPNGLMYDREWALVGPDGAALTQKRHPQLALLRPRVDLATGVLEVSAPGVAEPLRVRIDGAAPQQPADVLSVTAAAGPASSSGGAAAQPGSQVAVRVCGDSVCGVVMAAATPPAAGGAAGSGCPHDTASQCAADWLEAAVGVRCQLVQQVPAARAARAGTAGLGGSGDAQHAQQAPGPQARADGGSLGFANDGQFLLVSQASVDAVAAELAAMHQARGGGSSGTTAGGRDGAAASTAAPPPAGTPVMPDAAHYRPNLLVAVASVGPVGAGGGGVALSPPPPALAPFAEEGWRSVRIGHVQLAALGPCPRCEVLQVDQAAGQRRGAEVLAVLAARRRRPGGRLRFGVLLRRADDGAGGGAQPGCAAAARGAAMLSVGDPVWPSL